MNHIQVYNFHNLYTLFLCILPIVIHLFLVYNDIIKKRKGETQMDKKIGKLVKIVRLLTQLALEIGTLIAVIKMIIGSIR